MYQLYRDRPQFVLAIILANVILSLWSITLDSVINNDGVTYLAMAEFYLQGDWQEANSHYSWPFYPILIAIVSKLTFLDVGNAAYVLNTVLATSLCLAFLAIVGELSNNDRRTLIIAALIILLYPSITKYRAYVIRDFGYLSFYLWSFYFILRFCSTLNKKHLIGWLTATGLSCFFRFEGVVLMLIAPYFLIIFAADRIQHRKKLLFSLALTIIALCIAVISWYLKDKYHSMIVVAQANGENISSVWDLFISNISQQFDQENATLVDYIVPILNKIGSVLYDLIRRMAVFGFLLSAYAYWQGLGLLNPLIKRVWWIYLTINILMLIGFSFTNNLVVSRYTMASGLTILILAPLALNYILNSLPEASQTRRWAIYSLVIVLAFIAIDGLNVRTKKAHFVEAGEWMQDNFPHGTKLFSNDRLLVHYADLGPESNFADRFSNERMQHHISKRVFWTYDYFAISITPDNQLEDNFRSWLWFKLGRPPEKIFEGKEGRYVFIFNTRPHDKYTRQLKSKDVEKR